MLQPFRMPDYSRPYRSVLDEIRTAFAENPYPAIRRVLWEFDGESLVLEGTLSSYYLKQVVCSAVVKVAGIRKIVDRLEVREAFGEERTRG